MAWLIGRKGEKKGDTIPLDKSNVLVVGREDRCDLIICAQNISRVHAKIWRRGVSYVIEDQLSRNETFLNGRSITGKGPQVLRRGTVIRICENEFEFQEPDQNGNRRDEPDSSTIEFSFQPNSKQIIDTQSAEKLAILLEITTQLMQSPDEEQILPRVVDELFKVFKQADRIFLFSMQEWSDDLEPYAFRTRREDNGGRLFSRSIVRRCFENESALLISDEAKSEPGQEGLEESVVKSLIRSAMCVPIKGRTDRIFGVLQLDAQESGKKFTADDLKFVTVVASQTAIALENATQAGLERDLQLAHEIQRGFLPRNVPTLPDYEFAACYEPAQEVGGDYYDFIPLLNRRMAVMIGDVAGKGVAASLLMAKVSSAARYALLTESTPAAAVSQLNQQMCEIGTHDKFVTLSAAVLDPERHTVTMVNAGHLLPFLFHPAAGRLEQALAYDQGSLPLGVDEHAVYQEIEIPIGIGEVLIMFTDGVIDALNAEGATFHFAGIHNALAQGPFTPAAMAEQLLHAVEKHSKNSNQFDDLTVVSFGRLG